MKEQSILSKKNRNRTTCIDNYTASLLLPIDNAKLDKYKNDFHALLDISKDLIIEHAERRIDLFFYSLIAYHNTQIVPTRGYTSLQHGNGRKGIDGIPITQACHSSFLPSFVDKTLFNSGSEYNKCILSGTHFMDSLNMTIELPLFVNELDQELEEIHLCRKKSLYLIQQSSLSQLDPIQGMNAFFKMLYAVFSDIDAMKKMKKHRAPYLSHQSLYSTPEIRRELVSLQKEASFMYKYSVNDECINKDWLELMLGLSNKERIACESNQVIADSIYKQKIAQIQQEILNTKSSYMPPVEEEIIQNRI